jgi:tetratricopeptide (TPR) repeat protein
MPTQQVAKSFLGRTSEIETFTQWLVDPNSTWILYFYDKLEEKEKKGGVGKTWLLKKCAEIAKQLRPDVVVVMIDFFNVVYRDGVAIAEKIVAELQTAYYPKWTAKEFTVVLEKYRSQSETEKVEGSEVRTDLSKALQIDFIRLERYLGESGKSLLLFFDTFELIEQNPIVAILNYARSFPDKYSCEHIGVVSAGRNRLDWTHPNWKGREKEVQTVAVSPFTLPETIEYLQKESIYSQNTPLEQAQALYKLTEGRPILVGLVADVLNQRIMTVDKLVKVPQANFEPNLVAQINRLENPLNWVILFMAHAYHRFNISILAWIISEAKLHGLVQEISDVELVKKLGLLSFVRASSSGDDLVLHDEMRRLVQQYCWKTQDAHYNLRKQISLCMISYYEQELAKTQSEQERQAYTTETLYHKLFFDLNDGFNYFKEHFDKAFFKELTPFASALLQEMQQFEHLLSPTHRNDVQLMNAKLFRLEQNLPSALKHFQALEEQADLDWMELNRSEILEEKGRCHLLLGNFPDAIEHFKKLLIIEQGRGKQERVAKALFWLGFTDRSRGQFDDSINYFEQSISIYQRLDRPLDYANMLNNISFVYKLQGKTEEALRRCQLGHRIRERLYRAGQASETVVGLSLSTMGQIYLDAGHFVWGGQCFDKAFEIYNRLGRKREIAATYNRFGQIDLAKKDWRQAAMWFEKAQDASADIHPEAYVLSLNRQGRLRTYEGKWQESLDFFQKALDKAREGNDRYQQVENLIDLAEATIHLGQEAEGIRLLQEAETIARQWNYLNLLGHTKEIHADIHYRAGRYQEAFSLYHEYCRYLAMYNEVEYNKATRRIMDLLFHVPKDQVSSIIDTFIVYWSNQGMDKTHPDLINSLKDTKEACLLE